MSFKKVIRTTSERKGYYSHASFLITKRGVGSLRINQKGMKFLRQKRIELHIGDRIDIYLDYKTGKLAILKTTDGEFRLNINSSKNRSIRINSVDLTKLIKVNGEYDFQESDQYDMIMVPIGKVSGCK